MLDFLGHYAASSSGALAHTHSVEDQVQGLFVPTFSILGHAFVSVEIFNDAANPQFLFLLCLILLLGVTDFQHQQSAIGVLVVLLLADFHPLVSLDRLVVLQWVTMGIIANGHAKTTLNHSTFISMWDLTRILI